MAIPGVIVAHSRVLVNHMGTCVKLIRREADRYQHGLISEAPRVEDGADLPDDVFLLQDPDAIQNLTRSHAQFLAYVVQRLLDQREGRLKDVQQLSIGLVQV